MWWRRYASTSPNVVKIYIALEELGLPYNVHPVDVFTGKQFDADFRKLNPMAKVPVITDSDGPGGKPCTLFESGAILLYLAEKTGKLLPKDMAAKYEAIEWMMVQMTTLGPMFGQHVHFVRFAPKATTIRKSRYTTQVHRVFEVNEQRLGEQPWLGGAEYGIADIATYPWARNIPVLLGAPRGGEIQERHALGRHDQRASGGEEGACRGRRRAREDHAVRQGGARRAGQGVRPRPVRRRLIGSATKPFDRCDPRRHFSGACGALALPDTPVESKADDPYHPGPETRVSRLEDDVRDVKTTMGRLELLVTEIKATLDATLLHPRRSQGCRTGPEAIGARTHAGAELAELRTELAEKPSKAYMWGVLTACDCGLAALAILK